MTTWLISLCLPLLTVSTLCYGQTAVLRVTAPAVAGISRLEMVRLLRARDFERMDRAITSLQEAVERDISQERALNRAMNAFSTPDHALTPLLDAWVKERPTSYPALLARAEHHRALAWAARGDDWADRTSAEQAQAFKLHLARAVLDAEAALRLRPGLTNAVAVRISAAMGMQGVEECVLVFGRFYKQIGASLTVRSALSWCLLPRWGGSYEKLDTLAEEAAEHLDSNPALSVLAGMVAWDRGTTRAADHDVPGALRLYTDALRHGDHHLFLLARARIHLDRRRFGEALADIERALADSPEDTEALILRAWTLDGMGRPGEAAADVRLVAELDPYDEMLAEFRKEEVDRAVATARRRNAEGNAEAAIIRLNDAIALVGEEPEMLFWRGRSKLEFKDKAGALADLQRAVQLDPHHFDAILGIDFILVERGQYLTAVQHWNAYLALEPTNAKALLARAKAYIGRGDVQPGVADAKAACAAGVQEACLLASEVR